MSFLLLLACPSAVFLEFHIPSLTSLPASSTNSDLSSSLQHPHRSFPFASVSVVRMFLSYLCRFLLSLFFSCLMRTFHPFYCTFASSLCTSSSPTFPQHSYVARPEPLSEKELVHKNGLLQNFYLHCKIYASGVGPGYAVGPTLY